jgi:hypothetical protein
MMPTRWFPGSGRKVGNWVVNQQFSPRSSLSSFAVSRKMLNKGADWLFTEFPAYSSVRGWARACAGGFGDSAK